MKIFSLENNLLYSILTGQDPKAKKLMAIVILVFKIEIESPPTPSMRQYAAILL